MKRLLSLVSIFALFILGFGFQQHVEAATPIGQTFDVTVISYFGPGNTLQTIVTERDYGSKVQVTPPTDESHTGYSFAFWIVNGSVRKDLAVDNQFTVTENLLLRAVFKQTGTYAVVFMDANGMIIDDVQYVSDSGTADATPPSTLPTKPGFVYADPRWDGSYESITMDTVLILQYQLSSSNTYSVSVNGGTGAGTYSLNSYVTATANTPESVYFDHWEDQYGRIVSYESTYMFSALQNTQLTAVTSETEPIQSAYVTLSQDLNLRSGYYSYVGHFDFPSSYELIEFGLLSSTDYIQNNALDFDTANVVKHQGTKYNPSTNEFIISISYSESVKALRSYVVVDTGSGLEYHFSDNVIIVSSILIYEVYGGGQSSGATYNSDYVVLYNARNEIVDLTGYYIFYQAATSTGVFATKQLLSGTIPAHGFFLIKLGTGTSGLADLPISADVTGTIGIQALNWKIALCNSITAPEYPYSSSVVDFVGAGTANKFELSVASATSISTAQRRNYYFDTNNNSADFSIQTPSPLNSSSPTV